jgi:hypothetical protein
MTNIFLRKKSCINLPKYGLGYIYIHRHLKCFESRLLCKNALLGVLNIYPNRFDVIDSFLRCFSIRNQRSGPETLFSKGDLRNEKYYINFGQFGFLDGRLFQVRLCNLTI